MSMESVIYQIGFWPLFFLVFGYFFVLYFVLAPLFDACCKYFHHRGWLNKISDQALFPGQIRHELIHSFIAIVVFGFSGWPVVFLIRTGHIDLVENSIWNIALGLLILNVWNEVHFFLVHRLMHTPYLMRRVHKVHHKSTVPTVYSVYSLHWLEAFLLSTVMVTIAPFFPVAPLVLILYPLNSILFNYAGHCNYRIGNGKGASWRLFATQHNSHHVKFRKNYGFAADVLDRINNYLFKP